MIQSDKITFEMVAKMLSGYQDMKRKALQLQFELEHYDTFISEEDVIDTMTFSAPLGERIRGGQASDKTAKIAMNYGLEAENIKLRQKEELESDLMAMTLHMERLELYIKLLNENYAAVLRSMYIEGMTMVETAGKTGRTLDAVKTSRKKGITELVKMFNYIVK